MKKSRFKQFFNVHVKKIKIEINPKMIVNGLMKIWLISGHSKVHNFFLTIFSHMLFFQKKHILNPYNISQINFINKNLCVYRHKQ
jgi:hypothetical protein